MILFNADDYGINIPQSERILDCSRHGCLNGVSIFVNLPEAEACVKMLSGTGIRCRLHLNLVEGPSVSDPSEVPLLVNSEGKFCLSFMSFFGRSLTKRKEMKRQVKAEVKKQVDCFLELMGEDYPLRVDSHRHYHMFPVVWDALFESCTEDGRSIEELRIPAEPFLPVIRELAHLGVFPAAGFAKNMIMHVLAVRNRYFGSQPDSFDFKKNIPVFLGITFSTKMFPETVSRLLPAFRKIAERKGRDLELMFHPGGLKEGDLIPDEQFRDFYLSPDRDEEAKTLYGLNL